MDIINWGRVSWYFLHITALNYKDNLRNHYIDFYNIFKKIIPCPICTKNFNDDISIYGLENNINKESIFNWTIDLHNRVNEKNNLKIYTYDESLKYYEGQYNSKLINLFILEIIHYNITEYKKIYLLDFLKTVCYIYPDNVKRKVLTKFTKKFPPTLKKLKLWLFVFLIISDYDVNKLKN